MRVEETWYLLKTRPRQEKRALENLRSQNIECFCPEVWIEKVLRGKKCQILEILFPGYLFVNFKNSSLIFFELMIITFNQLLDFVFSMPVKKLISS